MAKIDMSFLNDLTVPEKLELLAHHSAINAPNIDEKYKKATLFSICGRKEGFFEAISEKVCGKKVSKKEFFELFLYDDKFYKRFNSAEMNTFLSKVETGINDFIANLDFENDLSFEYKVADENEVSIINPFKGLNASSAITGDFDYYFRDKTEADKFNQGVIPKILKGFNTKNAYEGTNKKGKILYRLKNSRSSDFKHSTRKKAVIKNVLNSLRGKKDDKDATHDTFVNQIRRRKYQINRIRRIVGKNAIIPNLTNDDKSKRNYVIQSDVEKMGNFVYDNVLNSLASNKKYCKATIEYCSSNFGKKYDLNEYQNIKMLAGILATKYILQYVDMEKYASEETNKALQDKLDNIIGKVCVPFGYQERMFAPAHMIAKKLCKDFFNNAKILFSEISGVYSKTSVDDPMSLDDAMFRTAFDPNIVGIELEAQAQEANPEKEPFTEEEKKEEEEAEAEETRSEEEHKDESNSSEETDTEDNDKEKDKPLDGGEEKGSETKDATGEDSSSKVSLDDFERVGVVSSIFKKYYVVHSKEEILKKMKQNKEETEKQDSSANPAGKGEENKDTEETKKVAEKTKVEIKDEIRTKSKGSHQVDLDGNIVDGLSGKKEEKKDIKPTEKNDKKAEKEDLSQTKIDKADDEYGVPRVEYRSPNPDEKTVKVLDVIENLTQKMATAVAKEVQTLEIIYDEASNDKEEIASKFAKTSLSLAHKNFPSLDSKQAEFDNYFKKLEHNSFLSIYGYVHNYCTIVQKEYGADSKFKGVITESLANQIEQRFQDGIDSKMPELRKTAYRSKYSSINNTRQRQLKSIILDIERDVLNEIWDEVDFIVSVDGQIQFQDESRTKKNDEFGKQNIDLMRDKTGQVRKAIENGTNNNLLRDIDTAKQNRGGAAYDIQIADQVIRINKEKVKEFLAIPRPKLKGNGDIDEIDVRMRCKEQIKNELKNYIEKFLLPIDGAKRESTLGM